MDNRRSISPVATVLATLALALGLVACGGSDDDGGGGTGPGTHAGDRVPEGTPDGDSGGDGGKDASAKKRRDAGGGSGADSGARDEPAPSEQVTLSGDEKQARRAANVTDGVYDAIRGMERTGGDKLVAGGGAEICDLMSEEARRQAIEYARRSSGRRAKWDCELAIGLLIGRSQRVGGFGRTVKAEIVGVNAVGDRATATIRFGKGPLKSIPLVREDGEWKLGTSPATGGGQE